MTHKINGSFYSLKISIYISPCKWRISQMEVFWLVQRISHLWVFTVISKLLFCHDSILMVSILWMTVTIAKKAAEVWEVTAPQEFFNTSDYVCSGGGNWTFPLAQKSSLVDIDFFGDTLFCCCRKKRGLTIYTRFI